MYFISTFSVTHNTLLSCYLFDCALSIADFLNITIFNFEGSIFIVAIHFLHSQYYMQIFIFTGFIIIILFETKEVGEPHTLS